MVQHLAGDHNETYRKIMAHCSGEALHYPTGITPWAIDIIGGLLQVCGQQLAWA